MNKAIYYINGALLTLTLISSAVLTSNTSSAETTSANASVIVPSACTFTATEDTAHTAEIPNGTYQANIGTTTLKTICNDAEGFSIYAIGFSNSENGNNKLLATVGGVLSPTNDINTGTNTSGSPSSWAMKLAQSGTGAPTILSGYDSYSNVPSTNTKVATLVPATSTSATTGSSITATYAANISGTQPAGTYNGKVKYTMVHPASETPLEPKAATPKCISYWPNASGVADSMADDCNSGPTGSGYGNNATANLWASNFKRDGYGFAGWTDKYDWVLNENDANGNGTGANAGYHIYGPNATITTPADMVDKGLSLYAVWVKSSGNLQSWNYCAVLDPGDVTALTDTRDNQVYAVAKLADGNCWMMENLRLDNEYTTGAANEAKAQGYAKYSGTGTNYGDFIGLADPENTLNWNNPTTANSLYYSGTQSGTATININTSDSPAYRFPRYNNQNTASPIANMTKWGPSGDSGQNTYSVGNWYTWPAAVADTSYYTSGTHADTSICPTGWHIPYGNTSTGTGGGNTSGGFYYLGDKLGATASTAASSNIWRSYPNNFIYSGNFVGSSPIYRGSYGHYWSSTVMSNSNYSYDLHLNSSGVRPGTDPSTRNNGFSVRCVVGS